MRQKECLGTTDMDPSGCFANSFDDRQKLRLRSDTRGCFSVEIQDNFPQGVFYAAAVRLSDFFRRRTRTAPSGVLQVNGARRRRRGADLWQWSLCVRYLLAERLAEQ